MIKESFGLKVGADRTFVAKKSRMTRLFYKISNQWDELMEMFKYYLQATVLVGLELNVQGGLIELLSSLDIEIPIDAYGNEIKRPERVPS